MTEQEKMDVRATALNIASSFNRDEPRRVEDLVYDALMIEDFILGNASLSSTQPHCQPEAGTADDVR